MKNIKLHKDLRVLLVVLISYLQIYVYSFHWNYLFYCKSWRLLRNLEHYETYVVVPLLFPFPTILCVRENASYFMQNNVRFFFSGADLSYGYTDCLWPVRSESRIPAKGRSFLSSRLSLEPT